MGNSEIKKELRQRIKLQGHNFDRIFPKKIISELFETLNAPNSSLEEFEMRLLFLTHSYLDIKKSKKDRLSAVQTAAKFKEIEDSIRQTRQLLKKMSKPERMMYLNLLGGINSKIAIQPRFRDKFNQGNAFRFPAKIGEVSTFTNIEVTSFFAGLRWMEICAKRIVARGEKPLPDGTTMKLWHKDTNDHVITLVQQLKTYWESVKSGRFSRDFLHRDGAGISPAVKFSISVARHLDPTLTSTQINSAMKQVITSTNKSKVAGK